MEWPKALQEEAFPQRELLNINFVVLMSVQWMGLAAFDDAIADGVDIITISVGRNIASDFDRDTIAIGSFMQCRKGY
ncbi:hypothetical protein ACFXTH_028424 [Malus domestica]